MTNLQIGKNGITGGTVEEIKAQFKNRSELKIKFLKAFTETNDRKEAAQELANKTGSKVKSLVGGSLILTRKQ